MSGNLPDKIERIDIVRAAYGKRKLCECRNPHYEVDYQNRLVTCTDCNAVVEPFQALYEIAKHYERIGNQVESLLEQRRQLENYKPHLVIIKELERQCRSNHGEMIPCCPKCGEMFELKELTRWGNKKFYNYEIPKEV